MRIKLLCPLCEAMREIKEGSIKDHMVTLRCGHERTTAALPLQPGRISVENLNVRPDAFPITAAQQLERSAA